MLSAIPFIAGLVRLEELGTGMVTPDNGRFFASPMPVVLHILSVSIFSLLGAFQVSPDFRRRKPKWHRHAGRILIPFGLMVALSGLWMTLFYPPANFDGPIIYVTRLVVGLSMILFLALAINAIRRRAFSAHGAWMIRAYALALGAGTQVFTHLPYFLFPTIQGELARTLCVVLGWVINMAVAEWIINRLKALPAQNSSLLESETITTHSQEPL